MSSDLLVREATSSMSEWLSVPLLLILAGVIVGRSIYVSSRQLDRQITWLLFWWLAAAVLREPWFQSRVLSKSVALSDVRLASHVCVIAGAVAVYMIVLAWARVRPIRTRTFVLFYVGVGVATVAQAWISEPARAAGIAVEELDNWRTAAYMVIYSAPMPLALTPLMVQCVRTIRRPDTSQEVRRWGIVVVVCAVISWFDHMSRLVNGIMLSFDWHNAFTELRSESNDILFLPAATVLAIVVGAPIIKAVQVRRQNDPASLAVVRLTPMWQDLVKELPVVALESTWGLQSSVEREHRMHVEVEDALYLLHPYMEFGSTPELDPSARCDDIAAALEHRRLDPSRTPTEPAPSWMADENALLRIADAWTSRHPAAALTT